MTAKKNAKKTSGGTVKDVVKNAAAPEPGLGSVKETALPTRAILHPRVCDFSTPIPSWVKTALLALLFFLLFQFVWTGAGKISSIYRQYREFRQWQQNILPPNPFDDDGNREGIRDFIKRHFPRGASRAETEEAARIFADAADRVESGELLNEDDLFGYLAENLRPVCLSAGWPDFVDGVWREIEAQHADAAALREAAEALKARKPLFAVEQLAEIAQNPSADPEPGMAMNGSKPSAVAEAGATAEPEQTPAEPKQTTAKAEQNCPGGNCPTPQYYQRPYSYGGLYWW